MRESQFYSFFQFISIKQYSEKRSNSAALLNKQKIMSEYFGWFANDINYMLKHTLSFLTRCAWHRDTKIISACKIVANGWHLEIWGPLTDSRRQGIKSETVDIGENFHLATGRAGRFISLSRREKEKKPNGIVYRAWRMGQEIWGSLLVFPFFSDVYCTSKCSPTELDKTKQNQRKKERETPTITTGTIPLILDIRHRLYLVSRSLSKLNI